MFYRIEDIPYEQTMQAVVARLLPLVPLQRREKALRYKHLHGQYCCLRTWQLLYELLTEHAFLPATFPLEQLNYTEDEYGKPRLELSGVSSTPCFSISHTKNAVAAAVSNEPVGIDVEALVPLSRAEDVPLLERTMSVAERQRIAASPSPSRIFTELWTCKEALYKAIGTGLSFDTLPAILDGTQAKMFRITSTCTDRYACAIAVKC